MASNTRFLWFILVAIFVCTHSQPTPKDPEEFHEPVTPSSGSKPVEDAYVGEDDPKPFHEPVPSGFKPDGSNQEGNVGKPLDTPLGVPSLVNIKLDIPAHRKIAVEVDKNQDPDTFVPKVNKLINLNIDIPSIFRLRLGDMVNGERRLGILAPFFKLDLTKQNES